MPRVLQATVRQLYRTHCRVGHIWTQAVHSRPMSVYLMVLIHKEYNPWMCSMQGQGQKSILGQAPACFANSLSHVKKFKQLPYGYKADAKGLHGRIGLPQKPRQAFYRLESIQHAHTNSPILQTWTAQFLQDASSICCCMHGVLTFFLESSHPPGTMA